MTRNILYFDIETVGNPEMRQFIPLPEPATRDDAPRNYKKPEAIAGWIIQENSRRTEEYNETVTKMALDVDYAKVIAIAYAVDDQPVSASIVNSDWTEQDLLTEFWGASWGDEPIKRIPGFTGTKHLCGFNILNFDLPILIRRSCLLRIPIPRVELAHYQMWPVLDLMEVLHDWGKRKYRGLKHACKMFGVPDPMPNHDGSMVADMDAETLLEYAKAGAEMARGLARKMHRWYWT